MESYKDFLIKEECKRIKEYAEDAYNIQEGDEVTLAIESMLYRFYKISPAIFLPLFKLNTEPLINTFELTDTIKDLESIRKTKIKLCYYNYYLLNLLSKVRHNNRPLFPILLLNSDIKKIAYKNLSYEEIKKALPFESDKYEKTKDNDIILTKCGKFRYTLYALESSLLYLNRLLSGNISAFSLSSEDDVIKLDNFYLGKHIQKALNEKYGIEIDNDNNNDDTAYVKGLNRIFRYYYNIIPYSSKLTKDGNPILEYFRNTFDHILNPHNKVNKLLKIDFINEIELEEDDKYFKKLSYKFIDGDKLTFYNTIVPHIMAIADYELKTVHDKLSYFAAIMSLSYYTDDLSDVDENGLQPWFSCNPYMMDLLPVIFNDIGSMGEFMISINSFLEHVDICGVKKDSDSNSLSIVSFANPFTTKITSMRFIAYRDLTNSLIKNKLVLSNIPSHIAKKLERFDKIFDATVHIISDMNSNNKDKNNTLINSSGLKFFSKTRTLWEFKSITIKEDLLKKIDENLKTTDDIEIYVMFCLIVLWLLDCLTTAIVDTRDLERIYTKSGGEIINYNGENRFESLSSLINAVNEDKTLNIDFISEFITESILNPIFEDNRQIIYKDGRVRDVIFVLFQEHMTKSLDIEKYTEMFSNIIPETFLTKEQIKDILLILDSVLVNLLYKS